MYMLLFMLTSRIQTFGIEPSICKKVKNRDKGILLVFTMSSTR